jgi:hypothetical protein
VCSINQAQITLHSYHVFQDSEEGVVDAAVECRVARNGRIGGVLDVGCGLVTAPARLGSEEDAHEALWLSLSCQK